MRVEGVLLEKIEQVMLVVRVQEVKVEEGFRAVGAGDGKGAVVDAKGGEGGEVVDMGCAQGAREGASADEADNEEGGKNEAEAESCKAQCESESSGEDGGERRGEVKGPTDKDGGGQASEGDGEAGEASGGHARDGMKTFRREIAHDEGARVEYEDAVAVAMAAGDEEADKGDADDEKKEGTVAECGKEGVLPFEVGGEVVDVGRPEAKGGDTEQGGAEAGEE